MVNLKTGPVSSSSQALRALRGRVNNMLSYLPWADRLRLYLHSIRNALTRPLSDRAFARYAYARKTGLSLNLDHPHSFADKLWWLKLHDRNPLLAQCADKYSVREYVAQNGLEGLLVPMHGVFETPDEVRLEMLPRTELFFKTTHGSGGNRIVDNSSPNNDFKRFKRYFNRLLKENYYWQSREWPYKHVLPRIVCETVLRNEDGTLPADWKIYCFGGEPRFIYYTENSSDEYGQHTSSVGRFANMYDVSFQLLPVRRVGWAVDETRTSLPTEALSEILSYARTLSRPFAFCRVDFYIVRGKIYFGEITFSPGGGNMVFEPHVWNETFGSWIDLSSATLGGPAKSRKNRDRRSLK